MQNGIFANYESSLNEIFKHKDESLTDLMICWFTFNDSKEHEKHIPDSATKWSWTRTRKSVNNPIY